MTFRSHRSKFGLFFLFFISLLKSNHTLLSGQSWTRLKMIRQKTREKLDFLTTNTHSKVLIELLLLFFQGKWRCKASDTWYIQWSFCPSFPIYAEFVSFSEGWVYCWKRGTLGNVFVIVHCIFHSCCYSFVHLCHSDQWSSWGKFWLDWFLKSKIQWFNQCITPNVPWNLPGPCFRLE